MRRMGKRDGLLRDPKMKRFAFIEAWKKARPIEALCPAPRMARVAIAPGGIAPKAYPRAGDIQPSAMKVRSDSDQEPPE